MHLRRHPYFFFTLIFFLVIFLPQSFSSHARTIFHSSLIPTWKFFRYGSHHLAHVLFAFRYENHSSDREHLEKLQIENQQLKEQLKKVQAFLSSSEHIESQQQILNELRQNQQEDHTLFFKRRSEALSDRIDLQLHSLPAKVVFRNAASWSEFVWVDVGEKDNEKVGLAIVCKNSPVLASGNIIGVIERVEKTKSLVRLITDPAFSLSVRVSRGVENQVKLFQSTSHLLQQLKPYREYNTLSSQIFAIQESLSATGYNRYLAKGELKGAKPGKWRSYNSTLVGEGFNYDCADEEGPALDLRTGQPYLQSAKGNIAALIQEGDLLITTGYDGIFPQGFPVAWVKKVYPLNEGSMSFCIDALPLVSDIDSLEYVTILPSIAEENST